MNTSSADFATWAQRLAVFDLETTGIDVATSRIVTANISVIDERGKREIRTDWLVNPGIDIPSQATAVHGISTERAISEGSSPAVVIVEIIDTLKRLLEEGLPLVVYNAPYDLTLLRHEAQRYGIAALSEPQPIIDPLVIDKALDRYRKGKRTLEATALHYEVELHDAHDAGSDALAAGRIAQALARRYPTELKLSAAELHDKQASWFSEQAQSFQEYMRRTKDPTFQAKTLWPVG